MMKPLSLGQQRRLDGVIAGMGWDGRTITGGRFVRVLGPAGRNGVSSHAEAALLNLGEEPTTQMLAAHYPDGGVLLQDSPFAVDTAVSVVVLSDRTLPDARGRVAEVTERVIDQKRIVRVSSGLETDQANPFDFSHQLEAAHIGSPAFGALFVVRAHQLVDDDLRERIVMLLADDEESAARIGCRAVGAEHPLAVEVFRPMWNPPMHGMLVMRLARRRRLTVDDCISFYNLPHLSEPGR